MPEITPFDTLEEAFDALQTAHDGTEALRAEAEALRADAVRGAIDPSGFNCHEHARREWEMFITLNEYMQAWLRALFTIKIMTDKEIYTAWMRHANLPSP